MLSNKMDLRVAIITFLLNSKIQLEFDILDNYFNGTSKKKNLARNEIYRIINSRCIINDYDEIDLLMSKYHKINEYNELDNPYSYYYNLISKLSASFISHRDGKFILKHWESKNEQFLEKYNGLNKIAMWNTLSRELNIDLLVFQYMINNGMDNYNYLQYYHSLVHIEDMQLERVLNKGVAETHMHIGAGINFEVKWHDLMNTETKKDDFKILDISIGEGIENENLKIYRYLAIIYRVLIAKYLYSDCNCSFKDYIGLFNIENKKLDCILEDMFSFAYSGEELKKIVKDIKFMFNVHSNKNYIDDIESCSTRMNKTDFLSSITTDVKDNINTSFENVFLFEALRYQKLKGQEDALFSKILYKYILIKNIFFRVSTQDNSIKGLDRFSKSFKRSTNLLDSKDLIYLAIHSQVKNRNLEKLEIRSSFPPGKDERSIRAGLKDGLYKFFNIYLNLINEFKKKGYKEIPSIGIIYIFKKYKDSKEKCWLNHYNYKDRTQLYYEKNRTEYRNQLNALMDLRENIPYLSNYIVGIDAASVENDTDPWVFSPIFKEARDSTSKIGSINLKDKINTLGFTFHVGEEFRHIISGFRKIDEVIENLRLKSGDRIGHGIALGVDVKQWIINNSIIVIPRIEYLENLLWVWHILTEKRTNYHGDINYIEREIMSIAKDIYNDISGLDVYKLYDSYKCKFENTSIGNQYIYDYGCSEDSANENIECKYLRENNIFCMNIKNVHKQNWNTEKITYSLHCEKYLSNMNEPIEVCITLDDMELIEFLQNEVKRKISNYGITIETNPTSNRSIGDLDSIFEHYISNLNSIDKFSDDNIMVSINTDDPCVFNTNINNEYAYIFYSLLNKGYDRNTCLEWIDKVRKTAIENSFIKTRNVDIDTIEYEINTILKSM